VLSEDYFLTDQVIMNPGDMVRPFVRADGTIEALLLSGGVVSHLSRSATAASGWTATVLPGSREYPLKDATDMAVATGTDGTVWAVFIWTDKVAGFDVPMYLVASLGSSDTWDYVYGCPMPSGGLGRLQSGVDTGGNAYFYLLYVSSDPNQMDVPAGALALWQPHIHSQPTLINSLAGVDMVDARVIWDPRGQGAVISLTSNNVMEWHEGGGLDSPDSFDPTATSQAPDVAALLWTGWVNYHNPDYPGNFIRYAYQMQSGDILFSWPAETLGDLDLGTFTTQVGQGKVAVWQDGTGLFGFAFLVGDTAQVISQYGNPGDVPPEVTAPIPLQPDVTAVFCQPADATQGTLFVVLADATLNVLAKDPVVGWSLVPVLQGSATLQELDAWRVQLSVTDANGVPVARHGRAGDASRERSSNHPRWVMWARPRASQDTDIRSARERWEGSRCQLPSMSRVLRFRV
jgi:hypothetical protein